MIPLSPVVTAATPQRAGNTRMDGSVGIEWIMDRGSKRPVVNNLLAGGPAALSNQVHIGDVLLSLSNRVVDTLTAEELQLLFMGEPGSMLTMQLQSRGEIKNIQLRRMVLANRGNTTTAHDHLNGFAEKPVHMTPSALLAIGLAEERLKTAKSPMAQFFDNLFGSRWFQPVPILVAFVCVALSVVNVNSQKNSGNSTQLSEDERMSFHIVELVLMGVACADLACIFIGKGLNFFEILEYLALPVAVTLEATVWRTEKWPGLLLFIRVWRLYKIFERKPAGGASVVLKETMNNLALNTERAIATENLKILEAVTESNEKELKSVEEFVRSSPKRVTAAAAADVESETEKLAMETIIQFREAFKAEEDAHKIDLATIAQLQGALAEAYKFGSLLKIEKEKNIQLTEQNRLLQQTLLDTQSMLQRSQQQIQTLQSSSAEHSQQQTAITRTAPSTTTYTASATPAAFQTPLKKLPPPTSNPTPSNPTSNPAPARVPAPATELPLRRIDIPEENESSNGAYQIQEIPPTPIFPFPVQTQTQSNGKVTPQRAALLSSAMSRLTNQETSSNLTVAPTVTSPIPRQAAAVLPVASDDDPGDVQKSLFVSHLNDFPLQPTKNFGNVAEWDIAPAQNFQSQSQSQVKSQFIPAVTATPIQLTREDFDMAMAAARRGDR